jgi:hypothetical protein
LLAQLPFKKFDFSTQVLDCANMEIQSGLLVESAPPLFECRSINDSWWFAAVPDSISNLVNEALQSLNRK